MAKKAKPGKTPEAEADDSVEKIEETKGTDVTDPKPTEVEAVKDDSLAAGDDTLDAPVEASAGGAGGADTPAGGDEIEGEILPPEGEKDPEPEPSDAFSGTPEPDPAPEPEPDPASEHGADQGKDQTTGATPIPVQPPEPVIIRKGGFVPLVLGGVVAAAIGFGAARYVLPEGWPWPGSSDDTFQADVTAKLDAQSRQIAEVAAKEPDLAPVNAQLAGIQAAVDTLAAQVNAAKGQLDALDTRLTDLEKRPITEGASPAAVAAYERELKALQEAMAAQRAEIEKMATAAAAKEANAEMTAQQAMQRSALSQIQTALDTGNGFAEAAASLTASGVTVPPALLQVAETGVASRAQLVEAFPDAARAALSVARKAEGGGGLAGFLDQQFNARSTAPREGTDADAVLSRAEAAVKEGRLGDAMAELDALPEEARAEMGDWLKTASTRIAALQAADTLAAELN